MKYSLGKYIGLLSAKNNSFVGLTLLIDGTVISQLRNENLITVSYLGKEVWLTTEGRAWLDANPLEKVDHIGTHVHVDRITKTVAEWIPRGQIMEVFNNLEKIRISAIPLSVGEVVAIVLSASGHSPDGFETARRLTKVGIFNAFGELVNIPDIRNFIPLPDKTVGVSVNPRIIEDLGESYFTGFSFTKDELMERNQEILIFATNSFMVSSIDVWKKTENFVTCTQVMISTIENSKYAEHNEIDYTNALRVIHQELPTERSLTAVTNSLFESNLPLSDISNIFSGYIDQLESFVITIPEEMVSKFVHTKLVAMNKD